jgi:hypothetical protein
MWIKQCCGSGSGAFLPPGSGIRIRDGAMVGSGMEQLSDPGWSNGRIRIRDKTSRIRNTGIKYYRQIKLKP